MNALSRLLGGLWLITALAFACGDEPGSSVSGTDATDAGSSSDSEGGGPAAPQSKPDASNKDGEGPIGVVLGDTPQLATGSGHGCVVLVGQIKCWGFNSSGQLGLGDKTYRGNLPGQMGAALPYVDLGSGRTAIAVAAGSVHSCALFVDGAVTCWGANDGQLGIGASGARGDDAGEMGAALPPVNLGSGRTALAITAGARHTCALLDDHSVKCWGYNNSAQLGLGDSVPRGLTPASMGAALAPVDLGPGRTALSVSAGGDHSCAVLDDHTLKCWGNNPWGELGLGDSSPRGTSASTMGAALPKVDVGAGRTVLAVSAGSLHTCALLDDHSVKCWGYNKGAQLGLGTLEDARGLGPGQMGADLPRVDLGGGHTATAVAAGGDHTCAILDDHNVKCWGGNHFGQLGLGDTATRGDAPGEMGAALPVVDLGPGRTAVALALGMGTTCARLDDGSVSAGATTASVNSA